MDSLVLKNENIELGEKMVLISKNAYEEMQFDVMMGKIYGWYFKLIDMGYPKDAKQLAQDILLAIKIVNGENTEKTADEFVYDVRFNNRRKYLDYLFHSEKG
ncbi:MAG: hypothetical protein ACOCQR_02290 [bacterium]